MTEKRSIVRSVGAYLPARVVTNDELAKTVDTSDEWIVQRTGIRQRHIAAEGENTSDLAAMAGRRALENAGLTPADIDLIIVATTTPDMTFPATATVVQQKLGMHHGAAFDIQAVCSGFVYAVATADSYLKNDLARRVLVIGAETASRILDWTDRTTCVLFGDGAGAAVMELGRDGGAPERGVLATALRSDGHFWNKLYTDGGPSSTQSLGYIRMEGREVFKHAVGMITDVVEKVFEQTGYGVDDLDGSCRTRPTSASSTVPGRSWACRRRRSWCRRPPRQYLGRLRAAGHNTAISDGRIKRGDLVMIEAMGGGFTWGASLIRW